MAESREADPQGTKAVGVQGADHRAAGRDGPQNSFGSGSGTRIDGTRIDGTRIDGTTIDGTTIDSDRLLTVAQIVQLTGYSEESIRRWIRKGALPIERVGPYRRVRVRFSVLRQLFPG